MSQGLLIVGDYPAAAPLLGLDPNAGFDLIIYLTAEGGSENQSEELEPGV